MERPSVDLARPAPEADQLERAVLGALLLERTPWLTVPEILGTPDVFRLDEHRMVYAAALHLFTAAKPVDILTVSDELRQRGELDRCGGVVFISELTNGVASAANIEYHARIVVERHIARRLIGLGEELRTVSADERSDAFDVLDLASARITDLYGLAVPIGLGSAADEVAALTDATPGKHYTFGIGELDQIAVLQAGLPHVFAGRPGIGKSIFCLEVCWHLTLAGNVLLFSPEMTKRQITARIMARETGVPYSTILRGRMDQQQMDIVTATGMRIADRLARLKVDPTGGVTPDQVRIRTERAIKQHGVVAFAVDHLHKMKTGDGRTDRDDFARVSQCMNGLTEVAKNTGLPALVMAQLNREVEKRSEKRPNMADLRGSGEIEQDAAVVGLLYRQGYYQPDPPPVDTLEINIAKNRDGGVGVKTATINPALSRIGMDAAMRVVKDGTYASTDEQAPF